MARIARRATHCLLRTHGAIERLIGSLTGRGHFVSAGNRLSDVMNAAVVRTENLDPGVAVVESAQDGNDAGALAHRQHHVGGASVVEHALSKWGNRWRQGQGMQPLLLRARVP
jgi:hypothetical protein